MTDHQLSTRDLAARSDSSDEADSSPETSGSSNPDSGARKRPVGRVAAARPGSWSPLRYSKPPAAELTQPRIVPGTSTRVEATSACRTTPAPSADHQPLFATDQSERFTTRWQEIQTSFVDQPRDAVAEADALVADLMQRLAASFSQERERLEAQWDRGDDVSTEDLRVALTRYRSFFDRLLSA